MASCKLLHEADGTPQAVEPQGVSSGAIVWSPGLNQPRSQFRNCELCGCGRARSAPSSLRRQRIDARPPRPRPRPSIGPFFDYEKEDEDEDDLAAALPAKARCAHRGLLAAPRSKNRLRSFFQA